MYYNDRLEKIKKDALHISEGKFEIFTEVYADLLIEELLNKIESDSDSIRNKIYSHFGLIKRDFDFVNTEKLFCPSLV